MCVSVRWCFLTLLCWLVSPSEQQYLTSPCPRVFTYQHDGQQWYGFIQIRSPPFGSSLKMIIKLSIGVRLPTRYVGRLELLGDRAEVIQSMISGGYLRYKIHFPLPSPLPTPTLINFNGQNICQGPPARGYYVTTINLDHSLSTETIGTQKPSTAINEIQQQQNNQNKDPLAGFEIEEYELVPTGDGNFEVVYKERPNPDNFARPSVIDGSLITGSTTSTTTRRPATKPPPVVDEEIVFTDRPTPAPTRPPTQAPASSFECGIAFQTPNALVVNGENVEKGEWPWIAAMFVKKISGIEFQCGGSLVSQKHVITAAHCVQEKSNRPVKVTEIVLKLGVHNIHDWTDENAKSVAVTSIELHPDFKPDQVLAVDIAILVLSKPVVYNQYIIPVCLWSGNNDQSEIVGRRGVVVGWGRDENGLRATPEPRKTDMPIVSTETCRSSRTEFQLFTNERTLCAGERMGSGPCNGDSGGGLFMRKEGRWSIRGIVSNSLKDPESFNTCNLFEYIIFTDVAKYNSWIRQIITS